MGFWSKLFGSKGSSGFSSPYTSEANDIGFNRTKEALGGLKTPEAYSAGNSSMGFGNDLFKQKYDPYQFKNPDVLSGKGGVYGETMNNMQRGLLRQAKGSTDGLMRNAQLTGSYSPGMMKNALMQSQQQTQEAIGDYGAKGALDLATEQARADQSRQVNQAGENLNAFKQNLAGQGMQAEENQKARALDLDAAGKALAGEEIGLKADAQQKQYFMNLLQHLFQSQVDPYAGAKGAQAGTKGWLPSLLEGGAKIAGAFMGGGGGGGLSGAGLGVSN